MSFITDEDHRLNKESKLPSYPFIDPAAYKSTEEYLGAVANLMARYARLSYRRGHSPSCQMWIYAAEHSDQSVSQIMSDAIKAYTGEDIAILAVHTSSMSQEQTGVNLALKV